jgi:hypothetical protein
MPSEKSIESSTEFKAVISPSRMKGGTVRDMAGIAQRTKRMTGGRGVGGVEFGS